MAGRTEGRISWLVNTSHLPLLNLVFIPDKLLLGAHDSLHCDRNVIASEALYLVYCVKSPFNLIVIPGLTRNPVFVSWDSRSPPPRGQVYPCESRGGNDSFGTNVKKCWTHHTSMVQGEAKQSRKIATPACRNFILLRIPVFKHSGVQARRPARAGLLAMTSSGFSK